MNFKVRVYNTLSGPRMFMQSQSSLAEIVRVARYISLFVGLEPMCPNLSML